MQSFHEDLAQIGAGDKLFRLMVPGDGGGSINAAIDLALAEAGIAAGLHIDDHGRGLVGRTAILGNVFCFFGIAAVGAGAEDKADVAVISLPVGCRHAAQLGGNGVVQLNVGIGFGHAAAADGLVQTAADLHALGTGDPDLLAEGHKLRIPVFHALGHIGEAEAHFAAPIQIGSQLFRHSVKERLYRELPVGTGQGIFLELHLRRHAVPEGHGAHAEIGAAGIQHDDGFILHGSGIGAEEGRDHIQGAILAPQPLAHFFPESGDLRISVVGIGRKPVFFNKSGNRFVHQTILPHCIFIMIVYHFPVLRSSNSPYFRDLAIKSVKKLPYFSPFFVYSLLFLSR